MWRHRSGRRRRRQFDVRGRRRQKRLLRRGGMVAGVVLAAVLLGLFALSEALRARAQLIGGRAALQAAVDNPAPLATPEGRAAAMAEVDRAIASISDARRRVAGSVALSLAGAVPGLRGQRAGVLQLVDDSIAAARAGRDLLGAVDQLAERTQVRDGVLPLDGLRDLQQHVRAAGEAIGERVRSEGGLWGPLGDSRREFDDLALSNSRRLVEGAEALGAARTFLGADAGRRYLVALQNNAEMRDQGAVLSYVVVRFAGGRMIFERGGSVLDIPLAGPAPTPLPEGTRAVFGPIAPTRLWQSVNASADFALSGRSMVDMYHQVTGQRLDGVVALDVPALAAVLRVVGPVAVEGVATPVGAENVGRLLLHDFYKEVSLGGDQTARRERQAEVMHAVIDKLSSGTRDSVRLGAQLGGAAAGGHLRLWSSVADEERVFERVGLGGGPATKKADRTFHFALENRGANKLDYFVKPMVRQVVELTTAGTAVVRTTVTIDNQAPVGETKPSYQLGPGDSFSKKPGDYLAWALLWGPAGSNQLQGGVDESGLNLSQFIIQVDAGQQREVTFQTVIPDAVRDGRVEIRLVPQARLEPVPLEIRLEAPGWHVGGAESWQGPWDRVRTFGWDVRRG